MFVDEDLPDDNLEGAVGGEIDHHTSQEQTDIESDSKGDLSFKCLMVLCLSPHCQILGEESKGDHQLVGAYLHAN